MKYRKKPIVIEAFEYDGDLINSKGDFYCPKWFEEAYNTGVAYYTSTQHSPYDLFIRTLEGRMLVNVGDYAIQGVNGELYPCKPDIFEKTYEAVRRLEKEDK